MNAGSVISKGLIRVIAISAALWLSGCTALHTATSKHDLDVQTRMSSSIIMTPVEPEQRTVFIQVRNSSSEPSFDLQQDIVDAIRKRGYQVVDNPASAHFWLQANVLSVAKEPPGELLAEFEHSLPTDDAESVTPEPVIVENDRRDSHVHGGVQLVYGGHVDRKDVEKVLAAALIIGVTEWTANAFVKDVYYTVLTDIQVSERIEDGEGLAHESAEHTLQQGESGDTVSFWSRDVPQRKYQTRILSVANQVNLDWADAAPLVRERLARVLAGMF
ncbi:conjugal transfer protein TraT [Permianibacter sp. IMCC34836]|nr:conjugal transfer protein TraT [Permianibacter fluminis]